MTTKVVKGEKMKCLFEGAGVALVTPFRNGKIDFSALENIIERDLTLGAKAIILLATTGEGVTVDDQERVKLIRFARKIINNRLPLIVGCGHNNFEIAKERVLQAKKLGADGALIVTPYYNKTTQRGLIEYYLELDKLGLPIIMYSVPSRTGLIIELDSVKQIIAKSQNIYGIKESSTDIIRIKSLCNLCNNKIAVYSGEDELNYIFYCLGAKGAVSVTANIFPHRVQQVYDLVKHGKYRSALKSQNLIFNIDRALFCETNPIPIKYFMSLFGLVDEEVRKPLISLSDKNKKLMKKVFKKYQSK